MTAKLSLALYEKLGESVANELVDWFNAVDATYRGDLREFNELNFARFDAKLEQRLAALEAGLNAKIHPLSLALDGKLDSMVAAHEFSQIDARFDRLDARFATTDARFEAAIQKGLRQQLGWSILMWISVLAALIART